MRASLLFTFTAPPPTHPSLHRNPPKSMASDYAPDYSVTRNPLLPSPSSLSSALCAPPLALAQRAPAFNPTSYASHTFRALAAQVRVVLRPPILPCLLFFHILLRLLHSSLKP
ncbi:hypothetical protein K438DRAFT_1972470 [Mycena galopus ATCC 62051]|nr:hypothetical protein K438DRAFT_1972470 [Mycena galopus ATCC 62051]